jgi:hypothetical protein
MPASGWKQLLAGAPWHQGDGRCPIPAYSEYTPPPLLGAKPYPWAHPWPAPAGENRWHVSAYEERLELRPGLEHLARSIVTCLTHLGRGQVAHGVARNKCINNPYWPPELAEHAGRLEHERYVVLLSLALSRTQDDKGRVRWTFFGGSEQGPARAFWKGSYQSPRQELPEETNTAWIRRLLHAVYEEPLEKLADLRRAGFRILPQEEPLLPYWKVDKLPKWTTPYVWKKGQPWKGVKYLLTFRPFAHLPDAVKSAYLAGELHLLPFPGSLLFWGAPPYLKLREELPFAMQIPLLHTVVRHEAWPGVRVPQSGWLHEPRPGQPEPGAFHGPIRNTYKRGHRWEKLHRHQDELAVGAKEDKMAHVLFSTDANDLGLYGKPMARNAQLWTKDHRLLLDGPNASAEEIHRAGEALKHGGLFGYKFHFPPMRVGMHEVYWHRPLVAFPARDTGKPVVLPDAPLGYLTAYRVDQPDLTRPIELWPEFQTGDGHHETTVCFPPGSNHHPFVTTVNVRKLLESHEQFGRALPRSFARQLLTLHRHESLENWLDALPKLAIDIDAGTRLAERLETEVAPADSSVPSGKPKPPPSLTFEHTAKRPWEVAYWKNIAHLATGRFINKDNADCVRDAATQKALPHHHRDLEALGDYLLDYYRALIDKHRMTGKALAGEMPFHWRTDFNFPWSGGWLNNQNGEAYERNLITVIPGRDRKRAVIMADHYDTAYMLDCFDPAYGGTGARLAAAGADDNHSATVTLMLGAPAFLEMSKAGKLACDVWLIHLTGEEFPSDCLGARHLCQRLVEGTLQLHLPGGKKKDLSKTRVQGVYVLDMVAHNNDRDRDVFQMAPGVGPDSLWLAYQSHVAAKTWNDSVPFWNRKPPRKDKGRGKRSADPDQVPDVAQHPQLSGEIRPPYDPRSTLYNTDGQIFSDMGVPVVLFMENYDINRTGYHDTHDTMENIDLDYGAAVAAIAIESVARAATEKPPK